MVTAVSRSEGKRQFATDCGASGLVSSSDDAQMAAAKKSFDLVLNTIPSAHDYQKYTNLVASGGKHIILGLNPGLPGALLADALVMGQSKVKASGIGGIEATQAVIDLCHQHQIFPDIKIVRAEEINEVYEKLDSANQDGLRYVIDIQASLNEETASKCTRPPPTLAPGGQLSLGAIVGMCCSTLCLCRWC